MKTGTGLQDKDFKEFFFLLPLNFRLERKLLKIKNYRNERIAQKGYYGENL